MDKATLSLHQLENGYCYNSDSLFLYAFIARFLKNGASVLDIGAGCGILGLLCARDFGVKITLIDIDSRNARLCQKNADFNCLSAEVLCADARSLGQNRKFDFIISNPPFYDDFAPKPRNNHIFLAKKAQNLPFENLARIAKTTLNHKGKFIFCYPARELARIVRILNEVGFNVSALQFIYPKREKNASLAIFCADFSKKYLEILEPIFNFIDSSYSAEAREIFAFCKTKSIKIKEEHL